MECIIYSKQGNSKYKTRQKTAYKVENFILWPFAQKAGQPQSVLKG